MACKTSTALLSSPLVTDSKGETEEGVEGDGELDGEGMGEAVMLWWRRVVVGGFKLVASKFPALRTSLTYSRTSCFVHVGSDWGVPCSRWRSMRCWYTVSMLQVSWLIVESHWRMAEWMRVVLDRVHWAMEEAAEGASEESDADVVVVSPLGLLCNSPRGWDVG